jgi:hypothetical protein
MGVVSGIAEALGGDRGVDCVQKSEAKLMVETALSIASSSKGEERLAEVQAEVVFGRGPVHRFTMVRTERRGQESAP